MQMEHSVDIHTIEKKPAIRDAAETSRKILSAAIAEFAEQGFKGARIDSIAKKSASNVRMIYYYFGGKEGLYIAVLERIYFEIREREKNLNLSHLPPVEAMLRLIDFTASYFYEHPEFLQITLAENLQRGEYIAQSQQIRKISHPLTDQIREILDCGARIGVFRAGIDELQLYITIVALTAHHVNHKYTLAATFGARVEHAQWLAQRREHTRDVVFAYLTP